MGLSKHMWHLHQTLGKGMPENLVSHHKTKRESNLTVKGFQGKFKRL